MAGADNKHLLVDAKKCEALCDCGGKHTVPVVRVASGEGAYSQLAEDCAQTYSKGSVLLLDDENTHRAAGASVLELLEQRSVECRPVTLPGDPVATEELAERICDLSEGHGLIIAVGAGTITDLGKYASDKGGIPFWSVPTAPSMNGYTSSIVAIKVRGVKRTLPSRPPRFIYVDPDVIRDSPLELRQAGFCDVLAKSVSDFDWRVESLLFDGAYCSLPSAIVHGPESRYLDHPEKIPQGDEETVMGLFEGLLFSGIAMTLAGSSAPASGGEHLISHFFDMRESLTGMKPNLHGLQVGAGVILSAACYRRLAGLEERDLKACAENLFETEAGRIPSVWGSLASEVEQQFRKKRDRLLQFDSQLPLKWPQLRGLFSRVRKPDFFVDLFRRTGLEMTLPSLGIPKDEFTLAAVSARTIRDRITVLDISAHAGVLEDAAAETVEALS
ncbi:MAG: iron-containing alcohol dehydrogenase [bacterium]|nr:MAG: iron-containing alcohol dehydrogenase [bacterium]